MFFFNSGESVDDEAAYGSFFFFCDDHALGLVPEEEGASVPGALVFGALLLQKPSLLVFKVDEHVSVVFDPAIHVFGPKSLLVVRHPYQVDTPTT